MTIKIIGLNTAFQNKCCGSVILRERGRETKQSEEGEENEERGNI